MATAKAKELRNPASYSNHIYPIVTSRVFHAPPNSVQKPVADQPAAYPEQHQSRCRAHRAFKYVAVFAVAVLFSALVAFSRPSSAADGDVFTHDLRLLQFSPSYREYIPAAAVDYLLELRHHQDASSFNLTTIRASHPLLRGVSDTAITALAQRSGWSVGYKDITGSDSSAPVTTDSPVGEAMASPTFPEPNKYAHPEYAALVAKVSVAELRSIVGSLSQNFTTRHYKSPIARRPSLWIRSYLQKVPNSTVSLFENLFNQPNVVGRATPVQASSNATILLGGHLDSTSQVGLIHAPGADDDASGTAVALHVFSILASSGWISTTSKYPIEVHAYAGEEGGLLGSAALAGSYAKAGREIRGMLNLEMVGWQPQKTGSSTITVLTDPQTRMSQHAQDVIRQYVPTATLRSTYCGYGCSDHYSWSDLGYPVVCLASYGPRDSELNPYYHSTGDTIDKLDFDRMADFARAAIGWALEVGSS